MALTLTLSEQVMIQTREVYLQDEVDFCDQLPLDLSLLHGLSKNTITLYINSNGGSVTDGIAIIRVIDKIQSEGGKVVGVVRGQALSMAFLILEACAERRMGKLDLLMAHGITTFLMGDMKDIDAEQKILSFWRKEFAERLVATSNRSAKYWRDILMSNTPVYYTPTEAIEYGLVDCVE